MNFKQKPLNLVCFKVLKFVDCRLFEWLELFFFKLQSRFALNIFFGGIDDQIRFLNFSKVQWFASMRF